MPEKKTIMLSAGGTGGHLFPAEALAQELIARGRKVVIVTDKRGHAFKSLEAPVHAVRAATLKAGVLSKLKAVFDMGAGIAQAARLVLKYRPGVVVGFGGYPSFPAVFAAQILRVPTVLHEQNAVLGKANAVLAWRAVAVAASVPGVGGGKEVETGLPLRAPLEALHGRGYAAPAGEMKVLITGGSQAASIFGEIVPAAAALLPQELRARLVIAHQAREAEAAAVEEKYRAAGVRAEIRPFFSDMAERLAGCHLFIGRSGASSVAEAAMAGRPALFVPLRHGDMQQKKNAEAVTGRGGGWIVMQEDFTPEGLAQKLREFMENPDILARAAAASAACARPGAAARLADLVEKVAA